MVPALLLAAVGCSIDNDGTNYDNSPPAIATIAPATFGAAPSAVPGEPTAASTIEIQGVVGVVLTTARIIEIRPTGEQQDYTKIALTPNATIMRAGGGPLSLEDVRPSDRIVGFGRPGDDAGTLVSDDVTIQQVIQGGAPGGG